MSVSNLIVAYHGCDVTVRDDLVSGRLQYLNPSENQYDWLGPGTYFFENDYKRALMFAEASYKNQTKRFTARPIANPAMVGAVLRVNHWLDMTIQDGVEEFTDAYCAYEGHMASKGLPVPENTKAFTSDADVIYRALDNAVISWLHAVNDEDPDRISYQAVRGAFQQGEPVAPTSAFRKRSHIQIALRDASCVVGWFLPIGVPMLTEQQYADAKVRQKILVDQWADEDARSAVALGESSAKATATE